MLPSASPKTYQDVKTNLMWFTSIILFVGAVLFYGFVLPAEHQRALTTLFGRIAPNRIAGPGVTIVLFELIGWIFAFAFEVHDRFYDRYFVRWRYYYDLDFLLPLLVRPVAYKLDGRFFRVAQSNKHEYMKAFYHFVADYEHEHKVKENLIVRFYEAVTRYWITQISEIVLLSLLALTFIYYLIYNAMRLPLHVIIVTTYVLVALLAVNRLLALASRNGVRSATADEIEDIHARFSVELEQQVQDVHQKFGLAYGQSRN